MLIALLAVLGVDLIVIVALLAIVVARRRRLDRRPGQFAGAIRVTAGHLDGLGGTWKRGSGRWVRDVLVWSKGPFLFRTVLVPVQRRTGGRPAEAGELKRMGDEPIVAEFECEEGALELASRGGSRELLAGPFQPMPRGGARR